jgi:hypothetical protein
MLKPLIIRELTMRAITPITLAVAKARTLTVLARCAKAELIYVMMARHSAKNDNLIGTMGTASERRSNGRGQ